MDSRDNCHDKWHSGFSSRPADLNVWTLFLDSPKSCCDEISASVRSYASGCGAKDAANRMRQAARNVRSYVV
jgi:hypothetical protein